MKLPTVQLNIAWMWDCEDCGRENFERTFVPEVNPERMAELAEEIGDDGETMLCAFPFEVVCEHCGSEFETEIA
tara:strand:- start:60 stop:281 length:222 start_codon:yes stop_codon:yes gene_type:complete